FGLWQEFITKIVKVNEDQRITEDELLTIVDEAENEGGINEQEGELIRSAIEFNDLDVRDVLTPRVDVVAASVEDSKEEIDGLFSESGYSRLSVYKDTIDDIIGLVHERKFNAYLKSQSNKSIEHILKPIVFV